MYYFTTVKHVTDALNFNHIEQARKMSKSRLPRLHSSPDHDKTVAMSSFLKPSSSTLKRKTTNTIDELEEDDQPRKLPAIASNAAHCPNKPHRDQSKNNTNISTSRSVAKPVALTLPRPPVLSTSRSKRANSAPPKSVVQIPARRQANSILGSKVKHTSEDKRFQDLENQLASIEKARAESTAKLAAEMDAERMKSAELYSNLQANQAALSRALATAKAQELSQRRDLVTASDEIETLKKKHSREIMDLEMDLKKRDREIRELNEDVRLQRGDLERERETISMLKSTISQLTNSQLTVTTQKDALQAQIHALQALLDESTSTMSQLRSALESEKKSVERLEKEARDAEGIRRKLHNMVQELKGNIRVFCRVRPVLRSDMTTLVSCPSSNQISEDFKTSKSAEGDEIEGKTCADIIFPDNRDHRDIVLCSSSESAMGQERKEVHQFSFDRVRPPCSR